MIPFLVLKNDEASRFRTRGMTSDKLMAIVFCRREVGSVLVYFQRRPHGLESGHSAATSSNDGAKGMRPQGSRVCANIIFRILSATINKWPAAVQ